MGLIHLQAVFQAKRSMTSQSEENYLKAIFKLTAELPEGKGASTNEVAAILGTRAASVTDMLKKLAEKGLAEYRRYEGASLTENGRSVAVSIIRKHRLWEVFLVEKLHFGWDEVHEIAEQLEHIRSHQLEERLDAFLGFPTVDPHGDAIPDAVGRLRTTSQTTLAALKEGNRGSITGVADHSTAFLKHLEGLALSLGRSFHVAQVADYDGTVTMELADGVRVQLSAEAARSLLVTPHTARS